MMVRKTLIITGTDHDYDGAPVGVLVDGPTEFRSVRLLDTAQRSVPCQWERTERGVLVTWTENALQRGTTREYRLDFSEHQEEQHGADGVRLTQAGDERLDVHIRGELFTSYHFGSDWHRPYFHPVIGPFEAPMTRGFPMVKGVPGETTDHVHHRSIWTAYGSVNSVDNWQDREGHGYTVHRDFSVVTDGPVYGHVGAVSDWVTPDKRKVMLKETREMRFYNVSPARLVDIDVTVTALEEDVLFGDTKEGGIVAIRVASSMDVTSGGRIENSSGDINEGEVWGKRAQWCDYSGSVDNKVVGVALFDHPENFRHPTYWHARDSGLMTSNPFGLSHYRGPGYNGDHTLPAGESLHFRHRIYIHNGDASEGKVAEKYDNYVSPPTVKVR